MPSSCPFAGTWCSVSRHTQALPSTLTVWPLVNTSRGTLSQVSAWIPAPQNLPLAFSLCCPCWLSPESATPQWSAVAPLAVKPETTPRSSSKKRTLAASLLASYGQPEHLLRTLWPSMPPMHRCVEAGSRALPPSRSHRVVKAVWHSSAVALVHSSAAVSSSPSKCPKFGIVSSANSACSTSGEPFTSCRPVS